jgi:hypothetical protein
MLHRGVTGGIEDSGRASVLVNASVTENETGFAEQFGEEGVVSGDHREQLGEGSLWEGGDLDLPTGFDRERRTGRKRELRTVFDQGAWGVGTERGRQTRYVQ